MESEEEWIEIKNAKEKGRREIVMSGKECSERLSSKGGVFPSTLWTLPLTKIEFSHLPSLTNLPSDFSRLSGLMEAMFPNNSITSISIPGLFDLSSLRTLSLESNDLSSLPLDSFGRLSSLQVLNLMDNKLDSLPDDFSSLGELLSINLGSNSFASFPDCLCSCQRLSTLLAFNNQIDSIPPELHNLTALQKVDFSRNKMTLVPGVLSLCPKLKEVKLDSNPYKDSKFIKILQSGKLKNIIGHLKKSAPKVASKKKPEKLPTVVGSGQKGDEELEVTVDIEQKGCTRPYIFMCLLHDIDFENDESIFKKFVDTQTAIHDSICRRRALCAIGTHDFAKTQGPYVYTAQDPSDISFVPLKWPRGEITASDLADACAQDDEDAEKLNIGRYFSLLHNDLTWPVLLDAEESVLSLSPIINGEISAVDLSTEDVLIECSGTNLNACKSALDSFISKCSKIFSRTPKEPLVVSPIKVISEDGNVRANYPGFRDLQNINGMIL